MKIAASFIATDSQFMLSEHVYKS